MPNAAERVGPRNVPRSAINAAVGLVSCTQCSTESTPARTDPVTPSAPIAWAATPLPHECASSTAAPISSGVNAVNVAPIPGVSTPPVATTLIALAPALISSRTARRTASAPSTSRANATLWPCPPVTVSARPAATSREVRHDAAVDRPCQLARAESAQVAHGGHTGRQMLPPR